MTVVRRITLTSDHHFGKKLPPQAGLAIAALPAVMRHATAMAFRGRSSTRGRKPGWLRAATDIRFVGHEGTDSTDLLFEAPQFGEAAEELYRQKELWPTKPEPADTGFEVFGDLLADVAAGNGDSERFDRPLLRHVIDLRRLLRSVFREIAVGSARHANGYTPRVTPVVIETAERFYQTTPLPRRVHLYGTLDMVRASTQGFGLKLETGEEARGILVEGHVRDLQGLLGQPVAVYGKAVYRPSGRLLRIDAAQIRAATDKDRFFAKVPRGLPPRSDLKQRLREARRCRGGVGAIIGKWPGNETEEQVRQALDELS